MGELRHGGWRQLAHWLSLGTTPAPRSSTLLPAEAAVPVLPALTGTWHRQPPPSARRPRSAGMAEGTYLPGGNPRGGSAGPSTLCHLGARDLGSCSCWWRPWGGVCVCACTCMCVCTCMSVLVCGTGGIFGEVGDGEVEGDRSVTDSSLNSKLHKYKHRSIQSRSLAVEAHLK